MPTITPESFDGEFTIARMTPAQREETIAVCNAAFGFGPGKGMDFGRDWPYLWNDDRADNMWLCMAGETIVGAAGMYPVPVRMGGVTFDAGCIGQVATPPAWRKRGIFTRLMNAMCDHADATTDFTWLGGDRLRYGRFGWATGGRRRVFDFSQRMLGEAKDADLGKEVRFVTAGDVLRIHKKVATHADGIDYNAQEFEQLMLQCGARGLICNDTWALMREYGGWRIMEAGGEMDDLLAIVARMSRDAVEAGDEDGVVAAECGAHHEMLLTLAKNHYRTVRIDAVGMFRISNLLGFFGKVAQVASGRCPGGTDMLSIINTDNGQEITITCAGGAYRVTPGADENVWEADTLAISEAVFGFESPEALGVPLEMNSPIRMMFDRDWYLPFALYAM
jgi:predicted N-acetyltransferase YhbS